MSIQFAARNPERVHSLVLIVTAARFSQDLPEFPWRFTKADIEAQLADIDNRWGEGALAELFFGSATEMPGVRDQFGRLQRTVSSPMMARLLWQATMRIDVREVLDNVRTRTLMLARPGDQFVPLGASAALGAGIPDAQIRTLPPGAHDCFDIADVVAAEILDFVCEKLSAAATERVLATVLFTEVVPDPRVYGAAAVGPNHRCVIDPHSIG